jgi:8-oxo-dGTP pyrophosphatase MutT (NUDIX family)
VSDRTAARDDPPPAEHTDEGIPIAATVVLVRDATPGPEVLLVERPKTGSFPGAWVFPGGRLEPVDGAPAEDEERAARRAAVRETSEETGLAVDPRALVALSRWHPPPGIPVRIRTWFFLAPAPRGDLVLAPDEIVAAQWRTPAEALAEHGRGERTLFPPTWVTLHGLRGHSDARSLLAFADRRGVELFETRVLAGAGGPVMLWREDADYGADAGVAASARADGAGSDGRRHRLRTGALPWVYEREF